MGASHVLAPRYSATLSNTLLSRPMDSLQFWRVGGCTWWGLDRNETTLFYLEVGELAGRTRNGKKLDSLSEEEAANVETSL